MPLAEATVKDHLATSSDHFTLSLTFPEFRPAQMQPGKIRVTTEEELKRFIEIIELGATENPLTNSTPAELDELASSLRRQPAGPRGKVDAQPPGGRRSVPTLPCSRCKTADLDCVYVTPRRGYCGPAQGPAPVAALAPTTIVTAPPVSALEFYFITDSTKFFRVVPSYSGFNKCFPIATFLQTTVSTSLPHIFIPNPVGGIGEPDLGFSSEIPRALPQRDPYLESFYLNFHAARPFIPPKEPLFVISQGSCLEPLLAAIRWIGSLYVERGTSHNLFKEAFRLIDGNPPKNGFLLQAMLLLIIGLHGNYQLKRAAKLMAEARDISIHLKMNTHSFATTNGQGIPILEESWRRTWWELYVVGALTSGVHQTNIFALHNVHTDVGLPCEEHQFLTGQIPPPMHPYDMENMELFGGRPFSSYTYRIQLACFLGTFQKTPTNVNHIDKLLANWMLRLPSSKCDAFCDGKLDEMIFQAIIMWNAISILLYQPHLQLDPSSTYYIKACAPNTPAVSSDAFNSHIKRTIWPARELSKLITYRVPLLRHTHFFAYIVTLSSTIHLSRWSLRFVAQDDEELRQRMPQKIRALIKYAEM
ncbi:hypothetical protein DER46DRAFT_703957 [Fusarium sp. MPI-SDFR-AT-0072]|nr:hypothetical protein DER46DRAFT_703957 [Fusarium sp. MPI-SDFR-AT-0072]